MKSVILYDPEGARIVQLQNPGGSLFCLFWAVYSLYSYQLYSISLLHPPSPAAEANCRSVLPINSRKLFVPQQYLSACYQPLIGLIII
jgi:hypothetical protein